MSRREWLALGLSAGLVAGSLAQPLVAVAQGPVSVGSEFRVNSYTMGWQSAPSVGIDTDGDFVISWQSNGQDGSYYGIYAQRYNANGMPQGSEFRVNTYTTGGQGNFFVGSTIGMDVDGDFVISWGGRGISDNSGIFAQRYNASGIPQGSEFQVNVYTTGSQFNPSLGMDTNGDFVISWEGQGAGDISGIYAQQYNASGVPQGSEFKINTSITGQQRRPNVGMSRNGDFVITWTDSGGQDGSGSGIFAQRYNANGTPQGSEFQINTYTTGTQRDASVGMDADGDFTISWMSGTYMGNGQDGSGYGIYAQRYNANGTPQGGEFRVNTYTTGEQGNTLSGPSVGMDSDGDFVIGWSGEGQSSFGIYARQYNASGDTTRKRI